MRLSWALLVLLAVPLRADERLSRALFQRLLDNAAARVPDVRVGIAIKDLTSGDEFLVNADQSFPHSSTIRVYVLEELYRQAAAKKISLDEFRPFPEAARTPGFGVLQYTRPGGVTMSLADYGMFMTVINDNSATNLLIDTLGMAAINESLAAQGTPEIKLQRKAVPRKEGGPPAPENVGTPRADMRAMELLYGGQVVDRATSNEILRVLALPKPGFLRSVLPSSVRFAGKTGLNQTVHCEIGIVSLEQISFIFCVMAEAARPPVTREVPPPENRAVDRAVAEVAKQTLTYFNAKGPRC